VRQDHRVRKDCPVWVWLDLRASKALPESLVL
jgi:hypothetical protein